MSRNIGLVRTTDCRIFYATRGVEDHRSWSKAGNDAEQKRGHTGEPQVRSYLFNAAIRYAALVVIGIACQADLWAAQVPSAKGWDAFASQFIEATFKARPYFAVWAGRHEFDGKLPDWSPKGLKKEIERL